MPFNPTLPAPNSEMRSEEMRNQFNGLKDLIDESIPTTEKGAANGVASLDGSGNVVQPASWNILVNKPVPVADGTYTVGIGTMQNGTITVVDGIITAIQEANSTPPVVAVFVGSGFEDGPVNGDWYADGTFNGKTKYRNEASNRVCSFDDQISRWYIGVDTVPNQGAQASTDDPPLSTNWSSLWWLNPGTTTAA